MRFLIDASLPRSVATLFPAHGHEALDVRDIGLRHAKDPQIAAHAKSHQMPLVSGDFDFADIRIYPPDEYFGLVISDRPEDAAVAEVLELVRRFLARDDIMAHLAGRLAIIDGRRIRVRPRLPDS